MLVTARQTLYETLDELVACNNCTHAPVCMHSMRLCRQLQQPVYQPLLRGVVWLICMLEASQEIVVRDQATAWGFRLKPFKKRFYLDSQLASQQLLPGLYHLNC